MVKLVISENEAGQRIDRFLRKYLKRAPLSMIYKTIRKDIKVNGRRVKEATMLSEGDELCIYISEDALAKLCEPVKNKTAKRQFKIAYEDSNILVADKPYGLLTHGDSSEKKNTLVNQVCGYLYEKGEYIPGRERTFSPAPVNRLDRNTTGLVVFGKNVESLRQLTAYIREKGHIGKYYMTIVCGCFEKTLTVDGRIDKDTRRNIVRISENGQGKEAATIIRPVRTGERFSLVEAELITGRTHQIRAHLAYAGFPLIGDPKYGNHRVNEELKRRFGLGAQLLHAYKLEFSAMEGMLGYLEGKNVYSPLPETFDKIMEGIGGIGR